MDTKYTLYSVFVTDSHLMWCVNSTWFESPADCFFCSTGFTGRPPDFYTGNNHYAL